MFLFMTRANICTFITVYDFHGSMYSYQVLIKLQMLPLSTVEDDEEIGPLLKTVSQEWGVVCGVVYSL